MKVLVVVDMQVDFIYGKLGTPQAKDIVPKIKNKIDKIDKTMYSVIFTQDTHYADYNDTLEGYYIPSHCEWDTTEWKIVAPLQHAYKDKIFIKSTFGSDGLQSYLIANEKFIEEIEFCGVCTDICVISNALMARMCCPNTPIIVNSNLCAGSTPEKHKAALEVMKSCLIEVVESEEE